MTCQESLLNPVGGTGFGEFRFMCKKMARMVLVKGKRRGRFPLRRIAREISDGTVTAHDLSRWYPLAVEELRKG